MQEIEAYFLLKPFALNLILFLELSKECFFLLYEHLKKYHLGAETK